MSEETKDLATVADAVLTKDVTFDVDIIHPTLLQKWRKQTKRSFKVSPATLGTMIKISKEFLSIDIEKFDKEEILDSNFMLIEDNARRMARIISIGVRNVKEDPPDSLINFFVNNLTSKELYDIVNIVLLQIDTVNFLKSIISARGVNILSKMNPKTQGSTIASGIPSVV